MISTLDHLIVAVKDLEEAEKNYKKIFGADPVWRGEHKALGTTNSIFNFKNTYFELFDINFHALTLISVLLFIGCMGKSAQLGLHTWLPDAMEGPTPVSALIHAATMVTAGVFLLVLMSPIIEESQLAQNMIAFFVLSQ